MGFNTHDAGDQSSHYKRTKLDYCLKKGEFVDVVDNFKIITKSLRVVHLQVYSGGWLIVEAGIGKILMTVDQRATTDAAKHQGIRCASERAIHAVAGVTAFLQGHLDIMILALAMET
ncbi:hypothetical protein IFM89_037067 [Coptis chinensis]|uniref:Uncharacterized protein n=1 Tax=Coptis chinensis TaxID=261450 RepID=A0A835HUM9_9MAGN|nr:hypothetical protein IFM89_037067 [Coptis chinensis]